MSELAQQGTFAPPGLEIRLERSQDEVRLALRGELDLASTPTLEQHLRDAEAARPRRLVLDLSGLEFMDSTGLQAVIAAQRVAESNGHELLLRPGPKQVQRLFELTGVLERLSFQG